jgi:hypothetical protein
MSMIDHVVLIRWKDGHSRAEIEAVMAQARTMEGIDGVESITHRRTLGPIGGGRDKGVTDLMVVRVADEAALARFGPAPLHAAFGRIMKPMVEDLTIIDVPA